MLLPAVNAAAHVLESTLAYAGILSEDSSLNSEEEGEEGHVKSRLAVMSALQESAVRCDGHHDGFLALSYLVPNTRVQAWRLHHSL